MKRKFVEIEEIDTSEQFMGFLEKYNYDNNRSEESNVEQLTDILKQILAQRNFDNISLGEADKDNNFNSWQIRSLFNALKEDVKITSFSISDCIFDAHAWTELSNMLKVNNSIQRLQIFNDGGVTIENADLLAEGIRVNKGIKFLEVSGGHENEAATCIMNALKTNSSIVQARIDNLITTPDALLRFTEFIKHNKTLVKLVLNGGDTRFLEETDDKLKPIIDALKYNNNLTSFIIGEDPIPISLNSEIALINLAHNNHSLVAFSPFEYRSADLMKELFEANETYIDELAKDLNYFDLSIKSPDNIRFLIKYDGMGKSLLKEAMKNMDNDREEETITSEICDYDTQSEKKVVVRLKEVENYRNDNFWYFSGVTKENLPSPLGRDNSPLPFDKMIWGYLASFCEFNDIAHPAALQVEGDMMDIVGNDSNIDTL